MILLAGDSSPEKVLKIVCKLTNIKKNVCVSEPGVCVCVCVCVCVSFPGLVEVKDQRLRWK